MRVEVLATKEFPVAKSGGHVCFIYLIYYLTFQTTPAHFGNSYTQSPKLLNRSFLAISCEALPRKTHLWKRLLKPIVEQKGPAPSYLSYATSATPGGAQGAWE